MVHWALALLRGCKTAVEERKENVTICLYWADSYTIDFSCHWCSQRVEEVCLSSRRNTGACTWSLWFMPVSALGTMQVGMQLTCWCMVTKPGYQSVSVSEWWGASGNIFGICDSPKGLTEGGVSDSNASLGSPESTEQSPIWQVSEATGAPNWWSSFGQEPWITGKTKLLITGSQTRTL